MFTYYTIVDKIHETSKTISLKLKLSDGGTLEQFFPGQYITVQIGDVERNYTLSESPAKSYYRITVKRELCGRISGALHALDPGQKILASRSPSGSFFLSSENKQPLVLLSGGVGLTPMISILNHLIEQNDRREVWFIHSTKSQDDLIMGEFLKEIARKHTSVKMEIFFTDTNDIPKHNDVKVGRITTDFIKAKLKHLDYSFFVCGPSTFITTFYQELISNGVSHENIHYEFFSNNSQESLKPLKRNGHRRVTYALTSQSFDWDGSDDNLLAFSERNGVTMPFSCRSGSCLTCGVKLVDGSIEYLYEPFVEPKANFILPCYIIPSGDITIEF